MTPERRETWQCERCAAMWVTKTPLVLRDGFSVGDGGVAPVCAGCGRGMERAPFAPLLGRQISPLLEELWTPVMAELGLVWRGDRMVRFAPLKGAGARARFGYSLAVTPVTERNTLAYHRTWRSAELDVFEWFGEVGLVNPLVARTTLAAAVRPLAEAAGPWFAAVPNFGGVRAVVGGTGGGEFVPGYVPGTGVCFVVFLRRRVGGWRRPGG